MRALVFFVAVLAFPILVGGQSTSAHPEGQPVYARGGKGWFFACWAYPGSRAVHGRLLHDDKELLGKRDGETLKTTIGILVCRGNYSPRKAPKTSTGWLFLESFTGPPFIRDRYDPKTNTER